MSFFTNKVLWITGASSGLGEALAVECAKEKAKIILSARRESELLRVKEECRQYTSQENILILPLDVAQLANAAAAVEKIIRHFGRIDVLINNAGVVQRSFVFDTPIEVERKIMEVNYFGATILSKAVLPYMRKQNGGNIVAISSVMGKLGFPGRATYSSSKHALHGYFEALRIEEKEYNIHTHLICPGYIKTTICLNGITSKGESYGKMDVGQEQGMEAPLAARKILRAIAKNKTETFIGGKELMALTFKRFLPNLFFKLILRVRKPDF
jgi:dehydrogenase/reductase SDR family member 7B